jgi:hypothetical protein
MPQYVTTGQAPQSDASAQTAQDVARVSAPSNSSQDNSFVPHAQIEPTGHTPSYWRLFTSAGIMRYGFEAFRDVSRDHVKPSGTQTKVLATTDEIVSNLQREDGHARGLKQLENYSVELLPAKWEEVQQQKFLAPQVAEELRGEVYKTVRQHEYSHFYDRGLGVASGILTLTHSYGTAQNIKKLYAETVALELDKKPQDVDYSDILKSKNQIVQDSLHNTVVQNAARLASDTVFFGRSLSALEEVAPVFGRARSVNFAYIGLALKGALLTKDITQKQSTVFETLTGLIDKKINSVHGIADAINTGDVVDIYQKYATITNPDNTFLDVTVRQRSDIDMDWPKSERMFSRIADLMNQTYKYKKSSLTDEERIRQSNNPTVDFSLPKFVHLLGQGLIDPTKPEQTMTLVEIAAHRDMKSLNEAVMMFEQLRASPEEVAERYGVGIGENPRHAQTAPTTQVHASSAQQSALMLPTARQIS